MCWNVVQVATNIVYVVVCKTNVSSEYFKCLSLKPQKLLERKFSLFWTFLAKPGYNLQVFVHRVHNFTISYTIVYNNCIGGFILSQMHGCCSLLPLSTTFCSKSHFVWISEVESLPITVNNRPQENLTGQMYFRPEYGQGYYQPTNEYYPTTGYYPSPYPYNQPPYTRLEGSYRNVDKSSKSRVGGHRPTLATLDPSESVQVNTPEELLDHCCKFPACYDPLYQLCIDTCRKCETEYPVTSWLPCPPLLNIPDCTSNSLSRYGRLPLACYPDIGPFANIVPISTVMQVPAFYEVKSNNFCDVAD